MILPAANGWPVRMAMRIARASSRQYAVVFGWASRQARMSAKISSSERLSSGAMRRQAPTEPPNPQARSPALPLFRSSFESPAGSFLRSIFAATTR